MLHVFLTLVALGPSLSSIGTEERCQILDVILAGTPEYGKGLSGLKCVVQNHYADGKVLMDSNIIASGPGAANQKTPFLKENQTCDEKLVQIPLGKLRGRAKYLTHIVLVNIRFLGPNRLEFNAYLHVYNPKDPEAKEGSIGIGCGAEAAGVLEKRKREWVLTRASPNLNGI